ncbi:MAG: TetR family transcriptional regulator [Solirubrobacteraceae bacterium]
MSASATSPKRMGPAERRTQLLAAARTVLARDGLARFSMEAVSREAGVAATLPRHYFASRDGLLAATAIEVIGDITRTLVIADPDTGLAERLRAYIAKLAEEPWAHSVWLGAARIHPDLDRVVQRTHRRMAELSYGRRWRDMSAPEQLAAAGWIGFADAAVARWIEGGGRDQRELLDALLDGARRLGVSGL